MYERILKSENWKIDMYLVILLRKERILTRELCRYNSLVECVPAGIDQKSAMELNKGVHSDI